VQATQEKWKVRHQCTRKITGIRSKCEPSTKVRLWAFASQPGRTVLPLLSQTCTAKVPLRDSNTAYPRALPSPSSNHAPLSSTCACTAASSGGRVARVNSRRVTRPAGPRGSMSMTRRPVAASNEARRTCWVPDLTKRNEWTTEYVSPRELVAHKHVGVGALVACMNKFAARASGRIGRHVGGGPRAEVGQRG